MARADFEDDRTAFDDLVALHTADDAGELHRRLLCFPGGGGNKADAFEPWCLFHHVHAKEPEGAVVTALLLLTDGRWRNATGRLVRQVEESGFVPGDQLDLLAQTFFAAGPQVCWEAPGDWFTGPAIVLDPGDPDVPGAVEVIEDDEPGGVGDRPWCRTRGRTAAASMARGARRSLGPQRLGAVAQRARQVDPRGGPAIFYGLLDSIGLLTPAARDVVLDLAETRPQRKLREAATALRQTPPPEPAPPAGSVASPAPGAPAPSAVQPSLF